MVDITEKEVLHAELGSANSINLNIENLVSGMYIVELSNGNIVLSYKKQLKN
jgi:hypothetical protein